MTGLTKIAIRSFSPFFLRVLTNLIDVLYIFDFNNMKKPNKIRIGINGFGRIGRALFRIISKKQNCDVVVINDIDPNLANLAYLYNNIVNHLLSKMILSIRII